MDGWMDGWMDVRVYGMAAWMDRWIDRWTDGRRRNPNVLPATNSLGDDHAYELNTYL